MDIVLILEDAISKLPLGDHSSGLRSILRHISVAVRHFQGGVDPHADRFTDAVYRTNQAYEGSLKEAFRVIAGKDPQRKTPHEIEKYFEDNKILRDRVLTQITRYRQDYRNPSTHDHKLDFDEDEALLAIISTCGFAKLLVDQIAERIAFDAASKAVPSKKLKDAKNIDQFTGMIGEIILESLDDKAEFEFHSELEGHLAGRLAAAGASVEFDKEQELSDGVATSWDMYVEYGDFSLPIETRILSEKFRSDDFHGVGYMQMALEDNGLSVGGHVMLAGSRGGPFRKIIISTRRTKIFVVTNYQKSELEHLRNLDEDTDILEMSR